MHIDRKKLGTMAWYRLVKVVYFVLIAIGLLFSALIISAEPSAGIGVLVAVCVLAEIVRQLFFYVVTGDFLSKKYKQILLKVGKIVAGILAVILVLFIGAKGLEAIGTSMCTSKLGELGTYESGTCDCVYGYTMENDLCVSNDDICKRELGDKALSIGEECRCMTGYSEIGGTCIETDDICAGQFGNAEGVPGEDKCVCKYGYEWNDQRDYCVKIQAPPPPPKAKCSEHGFKAVYNAMNDTCECKYGYVKINGICQDPPYCGENGTYSEIENECVCESGFRKENNQCVCAAQNSRYNSATKKCECNEGFYVSNNTCKKIPSCVSGSSFDYNEEICVCNYGYYLKNGNCFKIPNCTYNAHFDSKLEKCVCDDYYVELDGKCQMEALACGMGATYNSATKQCVCDEGYYKKNGRCQREEYCGSNGYFNTQTEQCVCDSGYTNKYGSCTKEFNF